MTKILEGTWAEIRAQQPDWENKRLRVEVLDAPQTEVKPTESDSPTEATLFDEMKDLVGRVSFDPTDLAARSEEYYAQLMDEKYPQGNE